MPISSVTRWAWLPAQDSWKYHLLLAATGIFLLGPLAGVTAAYMNFSLGFFVGGQVLAGLLGLHRHRGLRRRRKHGANYIQTAAASVASMSGMGVLIRPWSGWDCRSRRPGNWCLLLCIGMFGRRRRHALHAGAGRSLCNWSSLRPGRRHILRALTDPALLRRSRGKLAAGLATGLALGLAAIRVPV
jgi:hypothetical protein